MPYTTPTTISTSQLVTATLMNNEWVNNIAFLANPPSCRVFHNANQSLTNNTEATVAFNSERYDSTGTMHDNASNNSRITLPVAGVYVVTFAGVIEADNDYNYMYAYIRLNGSTILAITTLGALTDAGVSPSLNVTTTYKFAASDYVEVRIAQKNTSAGAHNLASLANYSPEFGATWIGFG